MPEQWEYLTLFLEADLKPYKAELQSRFPNQPLGKFTPRALIPQLDELGAQGWELVTCHPYATGRNSDIVLFRGVGLTGGVWTHVYFCVLKRSKAS